MASTSTVRSVGASRVAIVSNGFADGPAQALRDYLVDAGAFVVTVFHPLAPEGGKRHEIVVYEDGREVRRRAFGLPVGPPASFVFDPLIPLRMPNVDYWFGFNCVACARGLAARRLRRAGKVVYWCVDFVPNRFGRNPMTRVYDMLDALCCRRSDARFELSAAAKDAREGRHHLEAGVRAPARVVPMGAWTTRVPKTNATSFGRRRVVYLGHLVSRQGVGLLLDALASGRWGARARPRRARGTPGRDRGCVRPDRGRAARRRRDPRSSTGLLRAPWLRPARPEGPADPGPTGGSRVKRIRFFFRTTPRAGARTRPPRCPSSCTGRAAFRASPR